MFIFVPGASTYLDTLALSNDCMLRIMQHPTSLEIGCVLIHSQEGMKLIRIGDTDSTLSLREVGSEVELQLHLSHSSLDRIRVVAWSETSIPNMMKLALGDANGIKAVYEPDLKAYDGRVLILFEFYRHAGRWKAKSLLEGFKTLDAIAASYNIPLAVFQQSSKRTSSITSPTDFSLSSNKQRILAMSSHFNSFLSQVRGMKTNFGEDVQRFRNRTTMEAIVAACALVATADGGVNEAEKVKMIDFMRLNDKMKVFDLTDITTFFEKLLDHFKFSHSIGKAEALKYISKVKGNEDNARLVILVACEIGLGDGDFSDQEKSVVREICRSLGLNPSDFGM